MKRITKFIISVILLTASIIIKIIENMLPNYTDAINMTCAVFFMSGIMFLTDGITHKKQQGVSNE